MPSNLPKWRGFQIAGSSPAYWSLEWENENTGTKMGCQSWDWTHVLSDVLTTMRAWSRNSAIFSAFTSGRDRNLHTHNNVAGTTTSSLTPSPPHPFIPSLTLLEGELLRPWTYQPQRGRVYQLPGCGLQCAAEGLQHVPLHPYERGQTE